MGPLRAVSTEAKFLSKAGDRSLRISESLRQLDEDGEKEREGDESHPQQGGHGPDPAAV